VVAPPSKFKKVAIAAPLSPCRFSPDMVGSPMVSTMDHPCYQATSSSLLDRDLEGFHPAFGQEPALRLIWLIWTESRNGEENSRSRTSETRPCHYGYPPPSLLHLSNPSPWPSSNYPPSISSSSHRSEARRHPLPQLLSSRNVLGTPLSFFV
jgi:hypothetical protein